MTLESVTPSTAPVTPAHVPTNTENLEDFGQRISAVYDNAVAERKATRLEADAAEDDTEPQEGTDETVAGEADAEDDAEEAPVAKAKAKEAPAQTPTGPSPEEMARKASLANAARLERESVRRSTELAAKAAELKAQESKLAEGNAKIAAFEKAYNDPDLLLELLSEKVSPDRMARFFLEAGQPEKVAERRAKAAQEPVTSEITKLNAKIAAMEKAAADKEAQAAAVANRQESEKQFAARVLDMKADAPHAARLLNKRPKDFFALADTAATSLMAAAQAEGRTATWDDVIKDVNKQLHDFYSDLQEETASPAAPSTLEKTGKNTAAAKAPTVSNRAASERSAILDEDEKWDGLPFDERVKRAEKRARQTG